MRTRAASILSLLTNKAVVIAAVAAIAMVVGAMSVGAMIRHKTPFNTTSKETLAPDPTHKGQSAKHTPAVAGAETGKASSVIASSSDRKGAVTTGQASAAGTTGAGQTPASPVPPVQPPQPPATTPVIPVPQSPPLILNPIQDTGSDDLLTPVGQLIGPIHDLLPETNGLQLTTHLD